MDAVTTRNDLTVAGAFHAPKLGHRVPGSVSIQVEREVAFEVADLDVVANALRSGGVRETRVHDEQQDDQVTTYFDTASRLLAARKYSLRVRRYPDGHAVVTLKFREVGKSGNLRSRPELEEVLGPGAPEDQIWASLPARLGRQSADDATLVADIVLETRRHVLRCQSARSLFDVALDRVSLPGFPDYVRQVVEVELVDGALSDLKRFSAVLSELPGVGASLGGKRAHARTFLQRSGRSKQAE